MVEHVAHQLIFWAYSFAEASSFQLNYLIASNTALTKPSSIDVTLFIQQEFSKIQILAPTLELQ